MRLSAALSAALVAVASLRAEAPPLQGTMPEDYLPGLKALLQNAVERSPNTIAASINVEQQEAQKYSSFSVLYPSVNLNGSYAANTESETNSSNSKSKGFYYGAGVAQPIFQWEALRNTALIGSLGLKIAERQYAEAYRQLAILIREQYMVLIYKNIQLRNDNFKVRIAGENLAAQKARFESGSSSKAELQTFELALQDEELARDRAQDDFEYSLRQFMRLVGADELSGQAIPLAIPHPEFSASLADAVLSGFVGNGIESTFQSQVYGLEARQEDLQYSIAKVRLLPKFAASANYSYSVYTAAAVGSVSQVGLRSESFALAANWNIFDGFATRGAKISALASKRLVERQQKSYVDATVDSIAELRHQLGFSARSLSLAEFHFALLDSQVKRLGDDKALGFASQATIDSATLLMYSTEFNMDYARSDYLGHWTEFISLAGVDPAIENVPSRYVR